MTRQAPYDSKVRAKGWRFELDLERLEQSATWALAPLELRPWLVMMWMVSWKQTPCGSLEDDDALIAARMGMPPDLFAKHRSLLRRNWWPAEDGRLYHDTITGAVQSMEKARWKESSRKAVSRRAKSTPPLQFVGGETAPIESDDYSSSEAAGVVADPHLSRGTATGLQQVSAWNPLALPPLSSETPKPLPTEPPGPSAGNTRTSNGSGSELVSESDTGTGTGTGTNKTPPPYVPLSKRILGGPGEHDRTRIMSLCAGINAMGVPEVDPTHHELIVLIAQGASDERFKAAAIICLKSNPPKKFAYLLGIVKREMREAAAMSDASCGVVSWDMNRSSIEAKGVELGVGFWNEEDLSTERESFAAYTERIRRLIRDREA